MTDATKDVLERALELTPANREHLAREILASIEDADTGQDEPDPAFVGDLRRRVDRALSGASDPGEDFRIVLERLRRSHAERHGTPR